MKVVLLLLALLSMGEGKTDVAGVLVVIVVMLLCLE